MEPLRIELRPFTAAELSARIQAGLGDHELPQPWLHAITAKSRGMPGLAAMTLADLVNRDLLLIDGDGVRRLGPSATDTVEIDRLLGPGLYQSLHRRIAQVRAKQGPEAAEDLDDFLDLACLCGRNILFGPLADTLALDAGRRDRLLDLLDEQLVDPQPPGLGMPDESSPEDASDSEATAGFGVPAEEPYLDYLAYHHPDFPNQEIFRFRNPLLALHLRNRQAYLHRQARAERLLARLTADLPPQTRGVAELHLAVLDQVGDEPRRRALEGELFYWIDASHARSAQRQLTADLRARRVVPQVLWASYAHNRQRWPVWRRLAWLGAYQDQPDGIPQAMRPTFLSALTSDLLDAGDLLRALEVAEEALAIWRQALPAGHPEIARSLSNIGVELHVLGRSEEALARHEEALAIRRQALPASTRASPCR